MSKRLGVRSNRQSAQNLSDTEHDTSITGKRTSQTPHRETANSSAEIIKDGKTPIPSSLQPWLQAPDEAATKKKGADNAENASLLTPSRAHRRTSQPLKDESPHRPEPTIFEDPSSDLKSMSKESEDSNERDCLMIGIDFGTTYSGVAWAHSKDPKNIKIITDWDCAEAQNSDKAKAPTRIAYSKSRSDSRGNVSKNGNSTRIEWGYGIDTDEDALEWFKLLLLDKEDLAADKRNCPQIQKARQLLQRAGKTAVQAVSDYLRLLWHHAVANIEKDFGSVVVEGLPFQVVCTVPAVWTTQAVNRMRQAAQKAGILAPRLVGETTLRFVSEPEAAALATFDDLKMRPNFRKNDTFVVCDAGGGTVDLISYKVVDTEPLILAECVEGKGKLCGAVFMDQDFEELMKQLVGDDAWDVPARAVKELLNSQWENGIKRAFDDQAKDWKVRLPYEFRDRNAPSVITLNQGHIRDVFDNVISQIQMLVDDQVSVVKKVEGKLPVAVVLVGGFGSCRYLFKQLKLGNEPRGIDIYQSSGFKPWTSICRGAVLKALTNSSLPGPMVISRILRCHYGTRFHTKFVKGIHYDRDKYWNELRGVHYADDQMAWHLLKGDKITGRKCTTVERRKTVSTTDYPDECTIGDKIFTCDSDRQPSRKTTDVKHCYTIESALVDISTLKEHRGANGQNYREVNYKIEISVIGTALEFSLMYKGERVSHGQVQAVVKDSLDSVSFPSA